MGQNDKERESKKVCVREREVHRGRENPHKQAHMCNARSLTDFLKPLFQVKLLKSESQNF